jgi:hypothetical protein
MCGGRKRVARRGVGEWSFEWCAFCDEESLRILCRASFWLGVDGAEAGRGEPRPYESPDAARQNRRKLRRFEWCLQLENCDLRGLCFREWCGLGFEMQEDAVPLLSARVSGS